MFTEIFRFEIRYLLRQPVFWICSVIFFLLTFGAVTSNDVVIGGAIGSVNRNAPYVIMQILLVMSVIGVFATTAFVASAIYRDVEYNTQALFFSRPIKKHHYLFGRFFGSMTVAFIVFLSVVLAIMIGSKMPWLEQERIGPFQLMPYLFSLFFLILPNLILTGGVFFSVAALTRSMMYTYVGVVLFFVAYGVAAVAMSDLENQKIAALADPFGFAAFEMTTKYWTVHEKNTSLLPLDATLISNRLIWSGAGLLALLFTYSRFQFTEKSSRKKKKKLELAEELPAAHSAEAHRKPGQDFSASASRSQWLYQTRLEIVSIIRSVPFLVILFLGLFNIVGNSTGMEQLFGTPVYPVTHLLIRMIAGAFLLFLVLILTFYSGEIVWKERALNLSGVYDALPVRTWVYWSSKLTALFTIVLILITAAGLTAMGIQAYHNYFNFELPLYFKALILNLGIQFILIAVLAFFFQIITNNKYVGFLLMVLYFVSQSVLPALGLEHSLYNYAGTPAAPYSDMNGFGHFVKPVFWFLLYWSFVALLLSVLSHLFWVRGTESGARIRWSLARQRLTLWPKLFALVAIAGAIATGSYIFYNTNILNEYTTQKDREELNAEFEKKYKQYEKAAIPRVLAVKSNVDIFPEQRALAIRGTYKLKNKTAEPIHVLYVWIHPVMQVNSLRFAAATLDSHDKKHGYRIYKLASDFAPGEEMSFDFDLKLEEKGFQNSNSNNKIVYNGTFFNSTDYFPHFGYQPYFELDDRAKRKKYGLPPVQRLPRLEDESARQNNYISHESDWIDFETTVSTSEDQIAIAPGYLQKEWKENGRKYFHYKMDSPILYFWSYLSARYSVKKDRWRDVAIEIYYDPAHPYNVDRMIEATKKSLEYFTANFSPYQHRQVRILEFPRYERFAQSFPNTIPFSESIGFIARIEEPEDIDYVYYVTAHEVAHQWWAHQVIGGNVQGATVLSETLSQYSALMVMEKVYGQQAIKKFLKHELEAYLRGRGGELVEETPLLRVEDQGYIHYRKGSLIMYALKDYLGEKELNGALAKFIRDKAYQQPPYTTSKELLTYIDAITPAHQKYLLKDFFEDITLYENKVDDVTAVKTTEGEYLVRLKVSCKKFRSDGKGKDEELPVQEFIDIGIFGKKEADGSEPVLYLKKMRIDQPIVSIDLVVGGKPARVGIDPYNKLIDRNPDDNTKAVGGS